MHEERGASTGTVLPQPTDRVTPEAPPQPVADRQREVASGFPVFAVREWASRFYEQERLERDTAPWRLAWPFVVALVLAAGAAGFARRWQVREPDLSFGGTVVLAAAAIGMTIGGLLRLRAIRARRGAAAARPATVETLPENARALVLQSPRLRFRRPTDGPGFAGVRDDVAAMAPVGDFAASVLVWALLMRGNVDGTLEDWVRGRNA